MREWDDERWQRHYEDLRAVVPNMNDFMNDITNIGVKDIRIFLNLTQKDFGKLYDIPVRTLQNWENGNRECPKYVLALLLNQANWDYQYVKNFTDKEITILEQIWKEVGNIDAPQDFFARRKLYADMIQSRLNIPYHQWCNLIINHYQKIRDNKYTPISVDDYFFFRKLSDNIFASSIYVNQKILKKLTPEQKKEYINSINEERRADIDSMQSYMATHALYNKWMYLPKQLHRLGEILEIGIKMNETYCIYYERYKDSVCIYFKLNPIVFRNIKDIEPKIYNIFEYKQFRTTSAKKVQNFLAEFEISFKNFFEKQKPALDMSLCSTPHTLCFDITDMEKYGKVSITEDGYTCYRLGGVSRTPIDNVADGLDLFIREYGYEYA